ncbi:hypothetical protein [Coxiella-like endosymbiont]|uniref:hypothetical protein n=1 Tax=Coxiella-like endosymbiont TaxID=1592897 RepID=UPI002729B7C3|nr:hypothetical protein [Coxiella-like endosymbiont]
MGIGFSIGCGYLVDYFVKQFQLKAVITISFLTALFIALIVPNPRGYLFLDLLCS